MGNKASLFNTDMRSFKKKEDFMVFLYLHLNRKNHNVLEKSRTLCFEMERILLLLILRG
jgi:hypothetical protein